MWSKHLYAFSRPLKSKGLTEEIVTKIGVDNLAKSTTLESNKSVVRIRVYAVHEIYTDSEETPSCTPVVQNTEG